MTRIFLKRNNKIYHFLLALVRPLVRIFYRIDRLEAQNVPTVGGGLIVANYSSSLNGFFIATALDRPIRFLPLSSSTAIRDAVAGRELVCVFPEGEP